MVDPIQERVVKRRTRGEMWLSAEIGDYNIDFITLYIGSYVNILIKQTWENMGKPKLVW